MTIREAPVSLVDRLEERRPSKDCPFQKHCYCDIDPPHGDLYNRDGPEAATKIASLELEVERLRGALERVLSTRQTEAKANSKVDRMLALPDAYSNQEIEAAQHAAVEAMCAASEAEAFARQALSSSGGVGG